MKASAGSAQGVSVPQTAKVGLQRVQPEGHEDEAYGHQRDRGVRKGLVIGEGVDGCDGVRRRGGVDEDAAGLQQEHDEGQHRPHYQGETAHPLQ